MLEFERITEKNIDFAVQVHAEIFPGYSARVNYEESVTGLSGYEYFLIYSEGACVGITGIYSYPNDDENAWLGWFGIREGFRRKHFGTLALQFFEKLAVEKGYRFARLYTDEFDNDIAISFYKANGYTGEKYSNVQDTACEDHKVIIFSKSLTSDELIPWGNKNIELTEQISKQMP